MKRWLVLALMVGLGFGCDSESTKTYEFTGIWSFSGQSKVCDQPLRLPDDSTVSIDFDEITVKVYENETEQKEGNVLREETVPCSAGTFTIDDLGRGTYIVNVQAMAMDPELEVEEPEDTDTDYDTDYDTEEEVEMPEPLPRKVRAYFESTQEVVVPPKDDEQVEFEMRLGTGSIEVNWGFANSLQCGATVNDVAKVEVEIVGQNNEKTYSSGELDCTTGSWEESKLTWDYYTITVLGYDEDGNQTHVGSVETPLEIRPGTHLNGEDMVIVLLEPVED